MPINKHIEGTGITAQWVTEVTNPSNEKELAVMERAFTAPIVDPFDDLVSWSTETLNRPGF